MSTRVATLRAQIRELEHDVALIQADHSETMRILGQSVRSEMRRSVQVRDLRDEREGLVDRVETLVRTVKEGAEARDFKIADLEESKEIMSRQVGDLIWRVRKLEAVAGSQSPSSK